MTNALFDALTCTPEADIFLYLPDGSRLTHGAFRDRAARLAGALAGLGARPGDRVAAQIEKSADALALYLACVRGGFVFLPLNPAYTAVEVDYFIGDARPAVLVAAPALAGDLAPVAAAHGAALVTLGAGGDGTLADQAKAATPAPVADRGLSDLAAILYTSGTTGRSKGAMLTGRNLLSNAETLRDLWGFTAADVLLHALPVFHTHGLFVATNIMLLSRGAMILLPRFDVDQVFAHLPRATTMMGVPTFYSRMVADPRLTPQATAHMRLFISGSAPLLAETHRAFRAATGQRILERYGMTETNMNTSNPLRGDRRAGTVGPALPGVEVRVCDPAGTELLRGQTGMVEVRGPNVFAGYWNMPQKTAEELRPSGFFITGDLGVMAEDGYLTIVGRAKDLIIAGGLNIYPAEVEAALDALAGVAESAVIGVPHPDLGEAVLAIVTPRPGAHLTEAGLIAGLADRLARFKQPRRIIIAPDLPRNAMGKVLKAALRRDHAGAFGG
jgi:malonyl-CoA/methylmalonyl-CoA synthetase